MFPGIYGFTWDAGNVIFLGVFFTVAAVIAGTVILAALRATRDIAQQKEEKIRWEEDFHDLPAGLRVCRHELTGEIRKRTCPNGFDCRVCDLHPSFPRRTEGSTPPADIGIPLSADRLYHRGHTWAMQQSDGTMLVGLDEFGRRVLGDPEQLVLPAPGTRVRVNGTAWQMRKRGSDVRVLSPLDGVVVETGSLAKGWLLRIRPVAEGFVTTHLLSASEARAWLTRELEALELRLGGPRLGGTLADGGELVEDLPAHYPAVDWDAIWGEAFLEP
jgi:glycine cleavage system H lipoate-binding protein